MKRNWDINFKRISNLGRFSIGKYHGTLYKGGGKSNTDVGDGFNKLYLSALWSGGMHFFRWSNPKLQISSSAFIPNTKKINPLQSFQIITLEGYVAIVEIDSNTKAILYVNGCNFIDKYGEKTDTFRQLHEEFNKALNKFRIVKIN